MNKNTDIDRAQRLLADLTVQTYAVVDGGQKTANQTRALMAAVAWLVEREFGRLIRERE